MLALSVSSSEEGIPLRNGGGETACSRMRLGSLTAHRKLHIAHAEPAIGADGAAAANAGAADAGRTAETSSFRRGGGGVGGGRGV